MKQWQRMPVIAIGLSHRTTPLAVLERLVLRGDAYPKAYADLMLRPSVREAVVVSTCLRTEVFIVADRFHAALGEVRNFFAEFGGLPAEQFVDNLDAWYDDEAVRHVFRLAAGMESAVVGESEVLGQLRTALEVAQECGAAGASLERLFTSAIAVGRRIRTETGIARGTASLSHSSVEVALQHASQLSAPVEQLCALVVGAGDMGTAVARSLADHMPTASRIVVNRDASRAVELAQQVDAASATVSDLPELLKTVDIVITSTASDDVMFEFDVVEAAVAHRNGQPLLFVDLALPRDVDAGVTFLPGVTLVDLEELAAQADAVRSRRLAEIPMAEELIDDAVLRYLNDREAREVAPLISELYERAEQIRIGELARYRSRLGDLTDSQLQAVDALLRATSQKLLHEPVLSLKEAAGTRRAARLAAAARELYGL